MSVQSGEIKKQNRQKIQRLQNYAARIITNNFANINFREEDIVKSLKWQTFDERVHYFTALLMFKCIHGLAPNYLSDQIVMACEVHNRNTRLADLYNVQVPEAKTKIYEQSLMYNGALVWNSLPDIIKEAPNFNIFKYHYKNVFQK